MADSHNLEVQTTLTQMIEWAEVEGVDHSFFTEQK